MDERQPSMDRVRDKVTIVTGGARGIGQATAAVLAEEGARVLIADIDEMRGKAAAAEIGEGAHFVRHDVRREEDWVSLLALATRKYRRIDVLVHNAGIYLIKPVAETTVEELEEILAVNVRGVFFGMKHVAPVMAGQKKGSIINISSMDGIVGSEGHTAYGGSKGALRTMTKDPAVEHARKGVRVNSIHPAYIRTDMALYGAKMSGQTLEELGSEFPVGYIGEPIDVAYSVLYLASDESRYVTGAKLAIDGAAMAE
jgi:NAD(P)-dependent dehydrogenase (short-subunit alcohol dehydrogenase family)